jgi:nucleotide-binding universal stress UspA family protein
MAVRTRMIVVGVATLGDQDVARTRGGADPVLESAVRLAESVGAELHVVHAFELPDPLLWSYSGFANVPDPRFVEDYASRMCARITAQVEAVGGGEGVHCHALEGAAGAVLCAFAEEHGADLLMVGATRRGKLWRGLLGTTAERVVRSATAPVLVMHQPFSGPVRRVLLTNDLSPLSAAVHERGLDVAEDLFGRDLELRSLMVVAFDALLPPPLHEDALRRAADAEMKRFLDARAPRAAAVTPRLRVGEVPRQVAAEVDEWSADLVIVGTAGRSGASRLLLGSNAAGTLRSVPCNVLVVPASILDVDDAGGAAETELVEAAR